MVDLTAGGALEAVAWKVKNLEDYDARLQRAVLQVDQMAREHQKAALVIYEAALMKSGSPIEEVRRLVRLFEETFEDQEDELTIPRVSGIMNVEGDEWFFGDRELRAMTGKLLGQFQHRVAQYNYIDEREVLRRWADAYDTRLFIRRRIYETEPVVGVVEGFDLPLLQYLRVAAGGDTLVPSRGVSRALEALGYEGGADDYEVIARAELLALQLELPAPLVGEMLEDLTREGFTDFPEPAREPESTEAAAEETGEAGVPAEGGAVSEGAAEEAREQKPSPEDRAARRAAKEDAAKGEEPSRIQDPQAKDAPGVPEEEGARKKPVPPEGGRGDEPGTSEREEGQ